MKVMSVWRIQKGAEKDRTLATEISTISSPYLSTHLHLKCMDQ